jgi:glucokinase
MSKTIYIGTDGGATTSKVGGVWSDGSAISTKLLQSSTNSTQGPEAVVRSWVEAIDTYLSKNNLTWEQVGGVGLAVPGPFQRYGVFDHSANLPDSFTGFDVHTTYSNALAERAGRAIPLSVGNDGDMGGVAEAQRARGNTTATVLMLRIH